MADTRDVSRQESGGTQPSREAAQAMRPAVDIFEDAGGITLKVDMPGVSRDGLDIRVDNDTLSIEGDASLSMPGGMEALYADIRSTRYQRSFSLSGELDADNIGASLKDGVLTLRIHKRAEHRPRKIEVKTG